MQAAVKEIDEDAGPIRTLPTRLKPTRLKPAQQERLDSARLEYIARYRREPEHSALLQQFFEDEFERWFSKILVPPPAATNGKKKASDR